MSDDEVLRELQKVSSTLTGIDKGVLAKFLDAEDYKDESPPQENMPIEVLKALMDNLNQNDRANLMKVPYHKKPPRISFTDKIIDRTNLKILTYEQLITLETKGYIVIDNFIKDNELIEDGLKDLEHMYEHGVLKLAGMSRGDTHWIDDQFRGDYHAWLNNRERAKLQWPNIIRIIEHIDEIQKELNEVAQFGSKSSSIQATCYPGDGARYIRHLDSPNGSRKLTCLFYLNKDWDPQWGGVLRAYVDIEDSDEYFDVEPIYNRLLIFQSTRIEHEVLPTYKKRFALTNWFH